VAFALLNGSGRESEKYRNGMDTYLFFLEIDHHKDEFQHVWNVSWSTLSVTGWRGYVLVKMVNYSRSRLCFGQNCIMQHVWNVTVVKMASAHNRKTAEI
jgi:hypothetical protein